MSSEYNPSQFVSTNTNPNASCSASRWLTEEVFKLIDIVQRDEAIYNPRHKYYFCRPYVENFWREVDLKLEKNAGASLAKWTNLRISFRREYTNYLEERGAPPCWSYFDRMFFLHPYLRKKHQQPKSLDTQVQDALAHLSSLSNRMQRERTVAITTTSSNSTSQPTASVQLSPQPQQLDNYLDYFDETDANPSELDEMIDEEQQQRVRYHHQLDNNDIKSECEEPVDDFEPDHDDEVPEPEPEDRELHKMAATSSSTAVDPHRRYALQHTHHSSRQMLVNRLQMRGYADEVRGIRPRSQELQGAGTSSANLQTQPNISFVRPTFSKTVEMVSTTTHSGVGAGVPVAHDVELPTPSTVSNQQRHGQRLEANNSAGPALNAAAPAPAATATAGGNAELCDCKTDSDAMFLMSLLPDIQKLNGRDRGKIKIAFQNILQDYLYPD